MKKVKEFEALDVGVREYINKWLESPQNFMEVGNWRRSEKIIYSSSWDISGYYNDIDFVKRIDKVDFSPVHKLLFYNLYNSLISTEDELSEFLKTFSIKDIMEIKSYSSARSSFILERFLSYKANGNQKNSSIENVEDYTSFRYVFKALSGNRPKKELVEKLYLVSKFLESGDQDESFEDYYKNKKVNVFKKGKVDLGLFKNSTTLKRLYHIFINGYSGAMGETVNKGVTKKLETLPKKTYLKLIDLPEMKCKNLKSLDSALEIVSKQDKMRTPSENIDILFTIASSKIIESKTANFRKTLYVLTELFYYNDGVLAGKNKVLETITTDITDLIVEHKDELSGKQILAMLLPFYFRSFWLRTGNSIDSLILFSELCAENVVGTAKLLEHLAFYNVIQPPTITQWRSISGSELFDVIPAFAISLINNTEKKIKNENLDGIRYLNKSGYLG